MKSHNLLFLCLLLLLVSCSDHKKASEMFDSVNTVILANPDSALRMLDSLSSEIDLTDEAMSCHYNLLYIKAKDKANFTFDSDSTILAILPYFEHHTERLPEAYYYAGRVYSEMGDAPEALNYFRKSLELLPEDTHSEDVLKLKTVVLTQIGATLRYQFLIKDSQEYFEKAYICDSMLKDTSNMISSLIDIGDSYRDSKECDSAFYYYNKADVLCTIINNEKDRANVLNQEARLYYDRKQYKEALSCLLKISDFYKDAQSGIYAMNALVYYSLGIKDSASYYWMENKESGTLYAKTEAYAGLANIEMSKGNIDQATKYINKYLVFSDSTRKIVQAESVIKINKFYNYKHKSEEVNDLKISNMEKKQGLWMLGSVVVVILLVFFCAFHYMRTKQLNADLQLTRYRRLVEKMDAEKENTLTTEIKTHEKIHLSSIVRRVHNLIENGEIMKSDEWKEVEMLIDDVYPTFLRTLYELRFLNKTDLQICKLMKLGFSPNDVSKLIGRDKSTVSASRKKLAQKAFGRGKTSKDWDEYIRSL